MTGTDALIDFWTPYTPLHDNVIVIPLKDEDELVVGGVIMAKSVERAPTEGIVVAVGPGVAFEIPEGRMDRLIDKIRPNARKGSLLYIETRCLIEDAFVAHPLDVKVGDRVLFPTWVCNWQKHLETGARYACCRADQLLGVFSK